MPGNIFAADTSFPRFAGNQSADEKIDVVTDYLFVLLEELRYTLANLGQENFNDTELEEIGKVITKPFYASLEGLSGEVASLSLTSSGLASRVSDVEGNVSTLSQVSDRLVMKVEGHDGSISSLETSLGSLTLSVVDIGNTTVISLNKDGISMSARELKINGMVTFASLSGSGTSVINGDNIRTGKISAVTIDSCVIKVKANASGWNYGGYYMYYTDAYGEYLAGALMLDVLNGVPRVYLRSTVSGGKVSYLQLYSETYLNINAETYVMIGDPNKLVPIYLYGQLYINGTQIG